MIIAGVIVVIAMIANGIYWDTGGRTLPSNQTASD